MTTVDPADWLDRLGQDIAQADANSLHAVRTSLAGVAGNDPDTAVATGVLQLRDRSVQRPGWAGRGRRLQAVRRGQVPGPDGAGRGGRLQGMRCGQVPGPGSDGGVH